MDEEFEMPDKMVAILVRFLEQNQGVLSRSAREKAFSMLTEKEVQQIELTFTAIFGK